MPLLSNFVNALPDDFISAGFSLSLWGEIPTTGYMVSFQGFEVVVENPTISDVAHYVEKNAKVLRSLPNAYVGGWMDSETGLYYLDISENIQDKAQALQVAAERNQLAIFDLNTFSEIRVK